MTKTLFTFRYHWKAVLGWGLAASLVGAVVAQAQYFEPEFDSYYSYDDWKADTNRMQAERERRQREYEDNYRQLQRDFGLDYESQQRESARILEQFRAADRANERSACMMIDRNPAAQQRCLDGLR